MSGVWSDFYLDLRQSREQTLVITGQAGSRKAIGSSLSPCLLPPAGPRCSRGHVTAHCGPNELPEAPAEYLMRLLSVNGYCDQRRVPVHLAEGLHNSWPHCWVFETSRRQPSGAWGPGDPGHSSGVSQGPRVHPTRASLFRGVGDGYPYHWSKSTFLWSCLGSPDRKYSCDDSLGCLMFLRSQSRGVWG